MFETYQTLDTMHQVYWALAALASVVFIIQAIMTFVGFDADTDLDVASATDALPESGGADFDADGFHLISVKSVVCFILGFGWTGALCWDLITNPMLLALVATLVGLLFMATIAFLLFQMMRLNRDNTFRVEQVIGQNADVYLRIPARRSESGKIQVSYRGSMHELEAYTDDAEPIATGAKVRITQAIEGSTVLVTAAIA